MCGHGDGPEYEGTDGWVRARKEHTCYACPEAIRPGDLYHLYTACYDDEWKSFKHCARCWRIFTFLCNHLDEDCVALDLNCGEVWDAPKDAPEHALAFMTREEAQQWASSRRDEVRRHYGQA